MPKVASAAFRAAMQAQERRVVELYHWRLVPWGIEVRTCNWELALVVDVGDGYGAQEWQPLTVAHDTVMGESGLQVDRVDITFPNATAHIAGATPADYRISDLAMNGALDGAQILVYLYDLNGGNPFHHSTWRVEGLPSVTRSQVVAHLQSEMALLARQVPRTTIQEQCSNALFDADCGLLQAAHQVAGVATGGTDSEMYANINRPPGWFDAGQVTFSGGLNLAARRTVYRYEPGWFCFLAPLRNAVAVGDTFVALPGCPKTAESCELKFNNLARFRGFPYLPPPEGVL